MSAIQVVILALLVLAAQLASAQSQFTRQPRAGEMRFREMDRNNDGVVTRSEWRGSEQSWRVHDWNSDGILSGDEVRTGAVRDDNSVSAEQETGIWDDREDTFENLDVNRNNRIERGEWHGTYDSFQWLDRNNDGTLSRGEVVGRGQGASRGAVDRQGRRRWDPPPAAAQQGDCTASAPQVVDDIYKQVLERPADTASAGLTQQLASGRMTVRDIVAQVAKSDEHGARFFWEPVVASIYRQMLQRDPSQQELRDAASELASGQRRMPEVIARMARRASNSDEEAVKILYRRFLGREADPEGLRGFTNRAGSEGIESVAREIVASPEYRQRTGGNAMAVEDRAAYEAAVRSLYRHLLGRDPDQNGLRDLTQIAVSNGVDAVVDRMVSSQEYQQLFGTNVVPGRGIRYCGPTQE
jgi:hypothetical protein